MKASDPIAASVLKKTINDSGVSLAQIKAISFNADILRAVRKEMPEIKILLLTGLEKDAQTAAIRPSASEMVARLKELKADGVDCCANELVTGDYISQVKKAGLEFHVFVINGLSSLAIFAGYGVDSITTDCPTELMRQWNCLGERVFKGK